MILNPQGKVRWTLGKALQLSLLQGRFATPLRILSVHQVQVGECRGLLRQNKGDPNEEQNATGHRTWVYIGVHRDST